MPYKHWSKEPIYIAQRPEKVFSREQLLRDVWNYQFFGDQRTVDTHIKRLREKLVIRSRLPI